MAENADVHLYKKNSARRYIALSASVKFRIRSPTRSSADADNALDANEAVPNKWRADGTHNTYQSY